jgi:hypothetical protein
MIFAKLSDVDESLEFVDIERMDPNFLAHPSLSRKVSQP